MHTGHSHWCLPLTALSRLPTMLTSCFGGCNALGELRRQQRTAKLPLAQASDSSLGRQPGRADHAR